MMSDSIVKMIALPDQAQSGRWQGGICYKPKAQDKFFLQNKLLTKAVARCMISLATDPQVGTGLPFLIAERLRPYIQSGIETPNWALGFKAPFS